MLCSILLCALLWPSLLSAPKQNAKLWSVVSSSSSSLLLCSAPSSSYTLLFLAEVWWPEDTRRPLRALAGSSRAFRGWARRAASNFGLAVRRVARLTRAVRLYASDVFGCSKAEGLQPRGALALVDLLHLAELGWLPRPMVSAMQRQRCVWHTYQNLQVFPTRGGVEVETFECFVLFQGPHKVFWQLTATTEHEN